MLFYLICFTLAWLYRYIRLIVNVLAFWAFRPIPRPEQPTYCSKDVTVVIPTLDGDGTVLRETIATCLDTNPFEIILVTIDANHGRAMELAMSVENSKLRVYSVAQANKRKQLCRALPEVKTPITIFADDDVFWPKTLLPWILAPFEDSFIGGVGTSQRLRRPAKFSLSSWIWSFLGAIYLERRNFDIAACNFMDGGLPCLSGRTVAYRTKILQDDDFRYEFTHETWRNFQLNADDDNFVTRWMMSHGWNIHIQYHPEAEVQTTLEDNSRFLSQCLRWSRSNWRSNLKTMFIETHTWKRHPWCSYAVFLTTITAWALPYDALLVWLCYKATEAMQPDQQLVMLSCLAAWMLLSKSIKHLGHFIRNPIDIFLLPVSIFFGYAHGLVKLRALLTLNVTTWGSRENADADDSLRMIKL